MYIHICACSLSLYNLGEVSSLRHHLARVNHIHIFVCTHIFRFPHIFNNTFMFSCTHGCLNFTKCFYWVFSRYMGIVCHILIYKYIVCIMECMGGRSAVAYLLDPGVMKYFELEFFVCCFPSVHGLVCLACCLLWLSPCPLLFHVCGGFGGPRLIAIWIG